MRRLWLACLATVLVCAGVSRKAWGQAFAAPAGGWAYTFAGDVAVDGDTGGPDGYFKSLDGTWDHDNGSDQWDGSGIGDGDGLPGGVSAFESDGISFIRVQEVGDPRDTLGTSEPSLRKIYLTHRLTDDFTDDTRPRNLATIVDDGVTLHFRTRIATAATGPLDPLHPDGGTSADVVPWPERGIGYYQHNGGKSMIAIKQTLTGNAANVAFGFAYGDDVNAELYQNADGEILNGLILPHLLQSNDLSNASDPAAGDPPSDLSTEFGNIVAVDDPTAWQEFWVTIQAGTTEVDGFDDGTHVVNVYHDGAADPLTAQTFGINAASGTDFGGDESGESYIAIGAGATPRAGAFDLDFFSWAPGIHVPTLNLGLEGDCNGDGVVDAGDLACVGTIEERDIVLATIPTLPGDLDGNGDVAFPDFLVMSANFTKDVGSYTEGDVDLDGNVAFPDFLLLSANFGKVPPAGATAVAVPEPSSLALLGLAGALMRWVRRRG